MALVIFLTFVVLKILDNLFSMNSLQMQIIADVKEISKTVELSFILNVLSESSIHFPYFSVVLVKKSVVSFT